MAQTLSRRPTTLRGKEYYRADWQILAPEGATLEDILRPDYWQHVSKSLRPHHRIDVDAEDGAWTASLFVRGTGHLEAHVALLSYTDLREAKQEKLTSTAGDPEFYVDWGGPAQKHRVRRFSDKEVIKANFESREAAERWIKNRMQQLEAA